MKKKSYQDGRYKIERRVAQKTLMLQTTRNQGICETLRLVYDDVYNFKDEKVKDRLTELLIDATMMAKKMSDRLFYYKNKYEDKTGSSGKNLKYLPEYWKRKKIRRARWPI